MGRAMRKMGVYLGLLEDAELYDDEGYDDEYDEQSARSRADEPARPAPVANISERRRPHAGGSTVTSPSQPMVAELSRITTLHPRTYN
ncbi:MAG: cell division protein SepF, partial [Nocardioidaceae bacterium]